jgi:hypothetical protein
MADIPWTVILISEAKKNLLLIMTDSIETADPLRRPPLRVVSSG